MFIDLQKQAEKFMDEIADLCDQRYKEMCADSQGRDLVALSSWQQSVGGGSQHNTLVTHSQRYMAAPAETPLSSIPIRQDHGQVLSGCLGQVPWWWVWYYKLRPTPMQLMQYSILLTIPIHLSWLCQCVYSTWSSLASLFAYVQHFLQADSLIYPCETKWQNMKGFAQFACFFNAFPCYNSMHLSLWAVEDQRKIFDFPHTILLFRRSKQS